MRLGALVLVSGAMWAGATAPVSATVLLAADFATVVDEAGAIVHGRVVDVRSALAGPRRSIESYVTVAVIESIKGAAGTAVTFRVPNGQVGRYRRILAGAPEFAPGDEVVVFLRGRAPAMPSLVGLSQGLYRVSRDAAGTATVTPAARSAAGADRVARGDPARTPLPVGEFLRRVSAVLERGR